MLPTDIRYWTIRHHRYPNLTHLTWAGLNYLNHDLRSHTLCIGYGALRYANTPYR